MPANPFDTIQSTWFTMPPYKTGMWASTCVFCHEGFDMHHVRHISDVETVTTGLYTFTIELCCMDWSKTLTFNFERKLDVIKAHREFCRAYMKTGEFDYADLPNKKTVKASTDGEAPLA